MRKTLLRRGAEVPPECPCEPLRGALTRENGQGEEICDDEYKPRKTADSIMSFLVLIMSFCAKMT